MSECMNDMTFFFAGPKTGAEIMKFLEAHKETYGITLSQTGLISNEYLDDKKYPDFINVLAEAFPTTGFVVMQLYNEEHAGVPFYTLTRICVFEGTVRCESDSHWTNALNMYADAAEWDKMRWRLEGLQEDIASYAREPLTRMKTLLYVKTHKNIELEYKFPTEYCRDWSGTDIETFAFKSCKKIGMAVFSNCTRLRTVKLAPDTSNINRYAFKGCTALEEIEIYPSMKKIGQGAFADCPNLKKVIFHGRRKQWESITFWKGEGLTDITTFLEEDLPEDSVPVEVKEFDINDKNVLVKYNGTATDVVIPAGVKKIGQMAFMDCTNIKTVVIPESVTEIGRKAFKSCQNLTEIRIPGSVKKLGDEVFIFCKNLTSLVIPETVKDFTGTSIVSYCSMLEYLEIRSEGAKVPGVAGLKNLKKLVLPKTFECVSGMGYWHGKSLQEIVYKGSKDEFDAMDLVSKVPELFEDIQITFENQ